MKLILLGAPGAGKGTQAEVICQKNNIPTISTGNILREALKSGTEMGLKAKTYMESGKLVPDEILIGIIKDRLSQDDCKNGFILDGFPRTIPQAEALDTMGVEIDAVLDIEVADEDIVTRMSGRRVCEKCGSSYHVLYKQLSLIHIYLGAETVTVQNLTVAKVDAENNLIAIKGAVPGPNGGIVIIRDSVKA